LALLARKPAARAGRRQRVVLPAPAY
jgi:hypothetical protein